MGDYYEDLDKNDNLPGRLQLYTKGKAVDRRLVGAGHYGIAESFDAIIDLGPRIDVLPLARRPKAIDMSNVDALVTSHDPESSEFKRIMAVSQQREVYCMFGVSFLVFEVSSGRFLEFFCGSKSGRAAAKTIYPFLPITAAEIRARALQNVRPHGPLPMTLISREITQKEYSWHVPEVVECKAAIEFPAAQAQMNAQIAEFVSVIPRPADKSRGKESEEPPI